MLIPHSSPHRMKWYTSWGSNGSAQMLRESQTEGSFSVMYSEVESGWGGWDRSGKVLGTESEWGKVSSGFHLFPFIRCPWQKCQSDPCPRPQIKKPRNKGTRARNVTMWKSMTHGGPETMPAHPFRDCRALCIVNSVFSLFFFIHTDSLCLFNQKSLSFCSVLTFDFLV